MLSHEVQIWSVSLYDQWFSRYLTFYYSPLTTMLFKQQKKITKKLPKILNLNFTIVLYPTLVETLPMSMHEFLAANLLSTFRQDVV